jgi:hypothetical protein
MLQDASLTNVSAFGQVDFCARILGQHRRPWQFPQGHPVVAMKHSYVSLPEGLKKKLIKK